MLSNIGNTLLFLNVFLGIFIIYFSFQNLKNNKVLISKNETENSLRKKILIQEHKIYPKSIISIFK